MQNLGFALCISPWLRRFYKRNDPEGRAAVLRHLEFFNTQPHMAGFILGVVGRMEETAAQDSRDRLSRIESLKMAMSSSLAAVGDKLLWGTLKPLSSLFAAGVWVAHKTTGASWGPLTIAAVAAYLLVFNVPALWLRWRGIRLGYEWGDAVAIEMKQFNWQRHIRRLRRAGTWICAALIAAAIFAPTLEPKTVLIRAAGLAGCVGIKMLRLTLLRIYLLMLGIAALASLIGLRP